MIFALLATATVYAWYVNRSKYLDTPERIDLIRGWMVAVGAGGAFYMIPYVVTTWSS